MVSKGASTNVSSLATWESSNTVVATVSPTGLVNTHGFGGTEITASYQGVTGRLSVLVAPPPVIRKDSCRRPWEHANGCEPLTGELGQPEARTAAGAFFLLRDDF